MPRKCNFMYILFSAISVFESSEELSVTLPQIVEGTETSVKTIMFYHYQLTHVETEVDIACYSTQLTDRDVRSKRIWKQAKANNPLWTKYIPMFQKSPCKSYNHSKATVQSGHSSTSQ